MSDAAGKVLVTGGSLRIGAAICRRLHAAGFRVIIHANSSVEEAEKLAQEIDAAIVTGDLSDPETANELLKATGPVDYVVNNASAFPQSTIADVEWADVEAMMRLHLWAPLAIARSAAAQGAQAVVNLLDTRVVDRDPTHFAYHLSKQALANCTRTMAAELAPMRVNGVAPGPILEPTDGSGDNLDAAIAATKLRRAGTPEEVAEAVHFMLTATYTTGDILFVDGGRHL